MASTVISGAVGEKAAGKPAPNRPEDVRKIQELLTKAFAGTTLNLKDGVCDDNMKDAIGDFQRFWGGHPDCTVEPHGQTLKRLNRVSNPLTLNPISPCLVVNGGYVVSYQTCDHGPLALGKTGYELHLCIPDEKNTIEVTNNRQDHLLGKDKLGELLVILEKLAWWAVPVQCRLALRYKGITISVSNPQIFTAPIRPHNNRLLPLDEVNNGPKLTYQGDAKKKDFHGRMFATVPGYDKNVWVWAGKFETDNDFRGFDCITYVGTTCGGSNLHMYESGDMAKSLGAATVEHLYKEKEPKTGKDAETTVKLDHADPSFVKEFFAGNPDGYYLMYSSEHVVLATGGKVYEFKASDPSGYNCSAVGDWLAPYKTMKLTVGKLPNKPLRAV